MYESDSEPEIPEEFAESDLENSEKLTESDLERCQETGWDIAWKNFFISYHDYDFDPSENFWKSTFAPF